MQYPKNVKEIKNLNEFIRKARELETDKYWSNILYDCSSANYIDWTRRESRLKWKQEMIQKYLNYKNKIEESKLEEKATIDWNNYLTTDEVKKFLSKDDKMESAEEIIYSKEFEPRYKDLHNPLQAEFKNSWTRKELVQDLNDFYNFGHLITNKKLDESYTLKGQENGKSFDIAYNDNKDKLEKFKNEMQSAHPKITMWIDEDKDTKHLSESKQKIEEVVEIKYTPEVIDKLGDIRQQISSEIRKIEQKEELIKQIKDITNKCLKLGYRKQLKEFTRIDLENYQLKYNPTSDIRYNPWTYLLDLLNTTELNYDLIDFAQDYIISANVLYKYLTNNLTESKHKLEEYESKRNELLAKTKAQTITRYNKAQEYKGFYIYDIDTSNIFNKDSNMVITCKVGKYHSQVEIENVLYWLEYEMDERFHDLQVASKYVSAALSEAIDGMNIKVNCECRRLGL